ncbi:MAG TPA: CRISPR-associated helicase Cas3' [Candidatus Binataceae bacterium]|nr:CRISPR-associated helicase Cas3' [Candidatus Binataceae bacterium]
MHFDKFFKIATGNEPFAYQRKFAEAAAIRQLVDVPTSLGKTAMAVVAWLWRRFAAEEPLKASTPRRLAYCLPMRVLVEQTAKNAGFWIDNLKSAHVLAGEGPAVHVLMGGEDEEDWDLAPERETILVGTQDMLLSRALNRGYAASRARWPVQFGLLHTDCLWIFDEIQLMGAGLATTTQLEGFRHLVGSKDGHRSQSVWMSATLDKRWLKTVDFQPLLESLSELRFDADAEIAALAPASGARSALERRLNAHKPLQAAKTVVGETENLAREVLAEHKAGTRTIVVINTVRRARELYKALKAKVGEPVVKKGKKSTPAMGKASLPLPEIVLLHSRFRPPDRVAQVDRALDNVASDSPGTIIVSTQVIEAGVDISAATLFTELAPWASLVQRFGRCNRRGEDHAQVYWMDLPKGELEAAKVTAPYEPQALCDAAKQLRALTDIGLKSLPAVSLPFEHSQVIRRNDLIDLFDTTPDLAGNDVDIDRFIREVEDSDVRVFWRRWDQRQAPPPDQPRPRRDELCPAPIGEFRGFFKERNKSRPGMVWRWNFLDAKWESAGESGLFPGQVFMVHADAGGYSAELGWDPESDHAVECPSNGRVAPEVPDANDDDRPSRIEVWQTIGEHVEEVCSELETILTALPFSEGEAEAARLAARWHDRGKAHRVFQDALPEGAPEVRRFWAKAKGKWRRYGRPHFRHELASALAILDPTNPRIPDHVRDLAAYLAAAHHGKVRLSIRSLPGESLPQPRSNGNGRERRFARGIWDGDELPETDLGGGVSAPAVSLSLEPMELGLCVEQPFASTPSWAERMLALRDRLGPFRLAYLEAIVRAADMRASKKAEQRAAQAPQGKPANA